MVDWVSFQYLELGSQYKRTAHQNTKNSKAYRVVSLFVVRVTWVHWKFSGVVQCDTHEEHGETPAQRPKHSLTSVLISLFG